MFPLPPRTNQDISFSTRVLIRSRLQQRALGRRDVSTVRENVSVTVLFFTLSYDVISTLSVSEGVRTINYDWIERRFKGGKTSTKTIISFIEGLTLEVEKFYEAWSKVLRSNVTITDDKIIMNAWKDILSASNLKMGAYRQFSVSLLKDISTSFNVLLNQIRSTKVTMDNNEKNSLKKLAAKEAEVNKCEAALQKARKEDQAAAQAYEKMTQTHKGKNVKPYEKFLF